MRREQLAEAHAREARARRVIASRLAAFVLTVFPPIASKTS